MALDALKLAPNPPETGKITIFLKLKGLECSFFAISLFSNPLSPFIKVSNILNNRLTQNLALDALKLAPNPPNMGKITIFCKLKGLECSFFSYPTIFQPIESIYDSFKHSQLSVTPKLGHRGPKIGPNPTQNG